jgi:class 3 adenylate cyclase
VNCESCHNDNPPHARFCLECGTPLAIACAKCGTSLPPGSKFCLACGHKVAAAAPSRIEPASSGYTPKHLAEKILTSRAALEGERKQVTVLFCDIVGSTALAERLGEENMHAMLNRFFELAMTEVHCYEGTVNQFLGDGAMAVGDTTSLAARLKQCADNKGSIFISCARRSCRPPMPRVPSASRDAFTSGRGARDRGHQLAHPPIYGDRPCT